MQIVVNEKRLNTYYSINFIDENDVYVGWDDNASCCEDVGYAISDEPDTPYEVLAEQSSADGDLTGFVFNIIPGMSSVNEVYCDCLDGGGQISIEIVHPEKGIKYLHLYNAHNGYYGHEYLFAKGEYIVDKDIL